MDEPVSVVCAVHGPMRHRQPHAEPLGSPGRREHFGMWTYLAPGYWECLGFDGEGCLARVTDYGIDAIRDGQFEVAGSDRLEGWEITRTREQARGWPGLPDSDAARTEITLHPKESGPAEGDHG